MYDAMIDNERRSNTAGLIMSLNMCIETPHGFDYTIADCLGWLREGGFSSFQMEPMPGDHWMVIATK